MTKFMSAKMVFLALGFSALSCMPASAQDDGRPTHTDDDNRPRDELGRPEERPVTRVEQIRPEVDAPADASDVPLDGEDLRKLEGISDVRNVDQNDIAPQPNLPGKKPSSGGSPNQARTPGDR